MFVGYPPSHVCDVYRMLNMKTKHIIKSRDIKWLQKTQDNRLVKEAHNNQNDADFEDDDSIIDYDTKAKESVEGDKEQDTNPKADIEMKKLQGWFNPEASRIIEASKSGREPIVYQSGTALMMLKQPQEPNTFDEAINHPEEDARLKWREATHKEFKEMHFRGV